MRRWQRLGALLLASRPRQQSSTRAWLSPRLPCFPPALSLFGISLPIPSNEPLAGTDGSAIPFLLILKVAVLLPASLWIYKCAMMVLFQRTIIYLPFVPPGARTERLEERAKELAGTSCRQVEVESSRPTRWTRAKVLLKGLEMASMEESGDRDDKRERVVVIYLQGNAGTPLHRIPVFKRLLIPPRMAIQPRPHVTVLCVAPRSYWLSTRSTPTQSSLIDDYVSVVRQAEQRYRQSFPTTKFILYGHSLGGSVALHLLADERLKDIRLDGMILENPLPSVPFMVKALYPQPWLPYHYLGPLAFDKWDTHKLLREGGSNVTTKFASLQLLWIRSTEDEIIPTSEVLGSTTGVEEMYELAERKGRWVAVRGALHDTAFRYNDWYKAVNTLIEQVAATKHG